MASTARRENGTGSITWLSPRRTAYIERCRRIGRRQSTVESYEMAGKRIATEMKAKPIDTLTGHDFDEFSGDLDKTLGANTIRQTHAVLHASSAKWSKATLPSGPPSVYYELSSLTCPTTTRCIVLATRSKIVDSSNGYRQTDDAQLLLSSANGGRSWTVASLPSTVAAHQLAPSAVACAAGQSRCFAVAASSSFSAAQPTPVLLTSATSNGRWTAVPSTGPTPASYSGLADVEGTQPCSTNTFCAVVTWGSSIGVTGNGELHWHASTLPPVPTGHAFQSNNSITQISCLASGTCLALQDTTAYAPYKTAPGPPNDSARVLTDADRSSAADRS